MVDMYTKTMVLLALYDCALDEVLMRCSSILLRPITILRQTVKQQFRLPPSN